MKKRIYTAAGLFLAAALVLGGCGKEKVPESEFATADEAKEAAEESAMQMDMFNMQETQIIDEINKIDVMSLTPIQALQTLFDLQNKIKGM